MILMNNQSSHSTFRMYTALYSQPVRNMRHRFFRPEQKQGFGLVLNTDAESPDYTVD